MNLAVSPCSVRQMLFCLGFAWMMLAGCSSSSTETAPKPESSPPPAPSKPNLPVEITFVLNKDGSALAAHCKNLSKEPLQLSATKHPTIGAADQYLLQIDVGKTEIGDRIFHAGDTLTLQHPDYAPLTKKAE